MRNDVKNLISPGHTSWEKATESARAKSFEFLSGRHEKFPSQHARAKVFLPPRLAGYLGAISLP